MSKVVQISLTNFKSISDLSMTFNGCTALIVGKNNSGKTSFLKGVIDRIRFIRPDVMLKSGEKEGRGELILDSGEKFIWEFDNGRDKLTYLTNEARKSVTKEFGAKFFPPVFDIDKFLQSSPKEQVRQLQAIVGLDFSQIDTRYQKAYDARTERNREAEIYHVKLEKMMKVDRVEAVDLTGLQGKKEAEKKKLNELYIENKKANEKTRETFNHFKQKVADSEKIHRDCLSALDVLTKAGYSGDATKFVYDLNRAIPEIKEPTYIEEMPDRTELDKIDSEILKASEINAAAQKYKEYIDYKSQTEAARLSADEADLLVKSIEDERKKMIESVSFPKGISIDSTGITVDGLPLDRNQISTSKLYCSALRIASMNLGEVRTLYFDASFLDKITLGEIQQWANANDLQLLIERPDFDGGEIQYELIEA